MFLCSQCEYEEYKAKLNKKWELFDLNESTALCDLLDVNRNLLRKVEPRSRHDCPHQILERPPLYSIDHTVGNSYPTSIIGSKF